MWVWKTCGSMARIPALRTCHLTFLSAFTCSVGKILSLSAGWAFPGSRRRGTLIKASSPLSSKSSICLLRSRTLFPSRSGGTRDDPGCSDILHLPPSIYPASTPSHLVRRGHVAGLISWEKGLLPLHNPGWVLNLKHSLTLILSRPQLLTWKMRWTSFPALRDSEGKYRTDAERLVRGAVRVLSSCRLWQMAASGQAFHSTLSYFAFFASSIISIALVEMRGEVSQKPSTERGAQQWNFGDVEK